MIIYENIDLSKYVTLKIGGICKKFYVPESVDELINITSSLNEYYILGGGSNILINDKKVFENVIYLSKFNNEIVKLDNGVFKVGASVRLQKLIKYINKNGYGGIEYLYSVPGLVGGATVMNAGRGRGSNKQISDYIMEVEVISNGKIKKYNNLECDFEYRTSRFQNSSEVITSVSFKFDIINPEEGIRREKERLDLCKTFQDNTCPNAGSTFSIYNHRIMKFAKFIGYFPKKNVRFSSKTLNWLQNYGKGTYKEAIFIIERVKLIHKIFNKECKLEYKVWE